MRKGFMKTKKIPFALDVLGSCFFIGHIPGAPGTMASIAAMLALYFLPNFSLVVFIALLNILFFAGAIVSEKIAIHTKIKDASYIVIDEWFGMWLALFLVPKNIFLYLLGLIIFRIFDILKPHPISYLEKNIPGGLGIMLDDAAAGFFTFVILQIVVLFF